MYNPIPGPLSGTLCTNYKSLNSRQIKIKTFQAISILDEKLKITPPTPPPVTSKWNAVNISLL
jgi:hypothetical protein